MGNESGEWIMYGVDRDDPECLHTVDEAIEYVNEIGFLPLFKNEIPGFSLEERTVPEYWWSGDSKLDPWEWRQIIARRSDIAYGKFFCKKAGFIAKSWIPYFVNFRRDGYDFDALYDDGKASGRQKKIMDLFMNDNSEVERMSFEIKKLAGFGKNGEKNFDGTITELEMKTYLCVNDFGRKRNKNGQEYGWSVSKYSTFEHIWGYDFVTSCYNVNPTESAGRIAEHMRNKYPIASVQQINKIIGIPKK